MMDDYEYYFALLRREPRYVAPLPLPNKYQGLALALLYVLAAPYLIDALSRALDKKVYG